MKNMHKRNILFALLCICGAIAIYLLIYSIYLSITRNLIFLVPTAGASYVSYLYVRLIIWVIQKKDLKREIPTWI